MNRSLVLITLALLCHAGLASSLTAQLPRSGSQAQHSLDTAASEEKYTFLIFYKDNGAPTKKMLEVVKRGVEARSERATMALVNVSNNAERELVERFGISRAPLPLTVAVAPNGAMTSLIPNKISDEQIEESFVTPVMAKSMKAMQDGQLVFVCIQSGTNRAVPVGVKAFASDGEFEKRVTVVTVRADDPAEKELIRELESDVSVKGATTVFFAPPGVLVGKFDASATKEQMATALHKAGKCCDDPNCKHNRNGQSEPPTNGTSRKKNQDSGARR